MRMWTVDCGNSNRQKTWEVFGQTNSFHVNFTVPYFFQVIITPLMFSASFASKVTGYNGDNINV